MGLYDGEPWAELAKKAGFVPEDTETQARRAFEYAAGRISKLKEVLQESLDHHEYCGWGDAWEREVSESLAPKIQEQLDD